MTSYVLTSCLSTLHIAQHIFRQVLAGAGARAAAGRWASHLQRGRRWSSNGPLVVVEQEGKPQTSGPFLVQISLIFYFDKTCDMNLRELKHLCRCPKRFRCLQQVTMWASTKQKNTSNWVSFFFLKWTKCGRFIWTIHNNSFFNS